MIYPSFPVSILTSGDTVIPLSPEVASRAKSLIFVSKIPAYLSEPSRIDWHNLPVLGTYVTTYLPTYLPTYIPTYLPITFNSPYCSLILMLMKCTITSSKPKYPPRYDNIMPKTECTVWLPSSHAAEIRKLISRSPPNWFIRFLVLLTSPVLELVNRTQI